MSIIIGVIVAFVVLHVLGAIVSAALDNAK